LRIFGEKWSRDDVLRRVGDIHQIGGIEMVDLADGPERGVRAATLRTGTGLNLMVLPDRGLDIANAELNGIPFGWISGTGRTSPFFYDSRGLEWLRGFYGGLLVTCGLTHLGAPCSDQGEELGLHGRASNTPARHVCVGEEWDGDEYCMKISGEVRESKVFQPTIRLRREISARIGESKIKIKDEVENAGYSRSPHMILYHMNVGFPIVDEGSRLIHRSKDVTPRDPEAEKGIEEYMVFSGPTKGYQEQVFYHDMIADASGMVNVGIVNEKRKVGIRVSYPKEQLPRFVECKMMGEAEYVVGLEPSNCWVEGRDKDRERGILQFLEAGEVRSYQLEISFLQDKEALDFAGAD
jgi:hypothetical protein